MKLLHFTKMLNIFHIATFIIHLFSSMNVHVYLIVFWRKAECVVLHGVVGADGDIRPDHPPHHDQQQHQAHDVYNCISCIVCRASGYNVYLLLVWLNCLFTFSAQGYYLKKVCNSQADFLESKINSSCLAEEIV